LVGAALSALLASAAGAQMMGGDAATAGNGVGGRSFESGIRSDAVTYDPVAEYNKGMAALQAGKYQDANRDFDHALRADPKNAETLRAKGQAQASGGDLKGAVRSYDKSLAIDPTQVGARRDYALVLLKLGQADKAQAQLAQLKMQSDACGGSCPNASNLKAAMDAVQAALTPAGGAPAKPG
jgi:tetratricopeptide (TPR) repeat protein